MKLGRYKCRPTYKKDTMTYKAIDIHCHYNHGAPADTKVNELYRADLEFLLKEHAAVNITKTAFSSYDAVLSKARIPEENEHLFSLSEKNGGVYQWVVVDPRCDATFADAQRLLDKPKTLGIKIHSPSHGYKITEWGDKIFEFANKKRATVLMHPDNIPETVKIADKYPEMRLIIAHLSDIPHIEAVENAKHGNIYLDTSGGASWKNNIIEYAVERIGSEKIYFGTDTYSAPFQYGRIFFARISEEDKQNILFKNAERDFPAFKKG